MSLNGFETQDVHGVGSHLVVERRRDAFQFCFFWIDLKRLLVVVLVLVAVGFQDDGLACGFNLAVSEVDMHLTRLV